MYFQVKAAQFDIVKHIRQDMITVGLENAISTGQKRDMVIFNGWHGLGQKVDMAHVRRVRWFRSDG